MPSTGTKPAIFKHFLYRLHLSNKRGRVKERSLCSSFSPFLPSYLLSVSLKYDVDGKITIPGFVKLFSSLLFSSLLFSKGKKAEKLLCDSNLWKEKKETFCGQVEMILKSATGFVLLLLRSVPWYNLVFPCQV